jgi:hypothetical protein
MPTVKATIQFLHQRNTDEYNGVMVCVADCMQQVALTLDRNVQLDLELPIYVDPLSDEDETVLINVTSDQDMGIEVLHATGVMRDALTSVVGEAHSDMMDVGNIQVQ